MTHPSEIAKLSLWGHLIMIMRNAALVKYMFLMLMCLTFMGVINYYESVVLDLVIRDPVNRHENLMHLLYLQTLSSSAAMGFNGFRKGFIMKRLEGHTFGHFWSLIIVADRPWLAKQKTVYRTVNNGVDTVKAVMNSGTRLFYPISRIVPPIVFLLQLAGLSAFPIVVIQCSLATFGILFMRREFKQIKAIRVKGKDITDNANHQSENIVIEVLNGRGEDAKDCIVAANTQVSHMKIDWNLFGRFVRDIMEVVTNWLVYYATIHILGEIGGVTFTTVFITINKSIQMTWWLFNQTSQFLTSLSGWGVMEKFMNTYKAAKPTLGLKMVPETFLSDFTKNMEIRLLGKSGAGKTTYLRNLVIRASGIYALGEFLYLDQKMHLPKSTSSILSIMGELVKGRVNINVLCRFAEILGIENVINQDTIHKPFLIQPSGGEEKRILILRAIIGILMGKSKVRVIFNDEITAGLDDDSWLKVRTVISLLKTEFGVYFISIDHHHIDKVIEYKVYKKVVNIATEEKEFEGASWLIDMYKTESVDSKKNTEVLVWVPGVDPEPFANLEDETFGDSIV